MNNLTKRILVIADVIQQIKTRILVAVSGKYIDTSVYSGVLDATGGYGIENNGAAVQAAVCKIERCEVCAKGGLFLAYIKRFDGVDTKTFQEVGNLGALERGALGAVFGADLLSEIEAVFENGHFYVRPSRELTVDEINEFKTQIAFLRGKVTGKLGDHVDSKSQEWENEYLIQILNLLLENNGERLFINW